MATRETSNEGSGIGTSQEDERSCDRKERLTWILCSSCWTGGSGEGGENRGESKVSIQTAN